MEHIAQTLTDTRAAYIAPPSDKIETSPLTFPQVKSYPLDECQECGGAGYFRRDVPPGHYHFGKIIRCENTYHSEDRSERLARLSGLRPNELSRRLKDITRVHQGDISNVNMLDKAQMFIDNPVGMLFIYGTPGNAKSEVLISIVNEVNERGKGPAIYNKFIGLMDYIKAAFNPNTRDSYIDRFDRLLSAPVLCVDEMDKARSSEWADEFRFQFLDERYRQAANGESLTVFASNSDPAGLPDAIYDRLSQFTIVHNTAPSARPAMGVRI